MHRRDARVQRGEGIAEVVRAKLAARRYGRGYARAPDDGSPFCRQLAALQGRERRSCTMQFYCALMCAVRAAGFGWCRSLLRVGSTVVCAESVLIGILDSELFA